MRPRPMLLAAAVLGSAMSLWLMLTSEHDANASRTAALTLVVSWCFVIAGVLASARPPIRFGLMATVGIAVNLSALANANDSLPFTLGLVIGSIWLDLLVHALLAFPTGLLPSRGAR